VTDSRSGQGTVGIVAGATSLMNFRIIGVNSVTGGSMTTGTIGCHGNPTGMIDAGMVCYKTAMADRTITTAIMPADASTHLTGGRAHQTTVTAMAGGAGVMNLRIAGNDGIANRGVAPGTIGVHADHGVVVDRGMVVHKGTMAG